MKRLSPAVICILALVSTVLWQASAVSSQSSVQACMNPNSGEIKVLVKGGCNPGWVALTLSTDGSGDGRGPRVVDTGNKELGAYVGHEEDALRYVAPYWLLLPARTITSHSSPFGGTVQEGFEVGQDIYFDEEGCTGQRYIQLSPGLLARHAAPLNAPLDDGLLHFAGDPVAAVTVRSVRSSGGSCFGPFEFTGLFGPDTVADPDEFGVTPPFHIVDP